MGAGGCSSFLWNTLVAGPRCCCKREPGLSSSCSRRRPILSCACLILEEATVLLAWSAREILKKETILSPSLIASGQVIQTEVEKLRWKKAGSSILFNFRPWLPVPWPKGLGLHACTTLQLQCRLPEQRCHCYRLRDSERGHACKCTISSLSLSL
jgi:hypothetical protein